MILQNKHIQANTVFLRKKIGGLEFFNKTGIMHFTILFEITVYKNIMVNTHIIIF
jgi:hypothetical protein